MNANDKISLLVDKGTFEDNHINNNSIYVTGFAKINELKVYIFATNQNYNPSTDTRKEIFKHEISFINEANTYPFLVLLDTIEDKYKKRGKQILSETSNYLLMSEYGVGGLYRAFGELKGTVPIICVIFGNITSSKSFIAGFSDIVIMLKNTHLCLGSPSIVKMMIGETNNFNDLAGAYTHSTISGISDILCDTEEKAKKTIKQLVSLLSRHKFHSSNTNFYPNKNNLVPIDITNLDIKSLIKNIADTNSVVEYKELYAKEIYTVFSKISGISVGILANNSKQRGGIIFPETCDKMITFINLCNQFNFPLIFLGDTPGFMIGQQSENNAIIKKGAKLFETIVKVKTPKITIIINKAHSAGLYAMAGRGLKPNNFISFSNAYISIFSDYTLKKMFNDDFFDENNFVASKNNKKTLSDLEKNKLIDKVIEPKNITEVHFPYLPLMLC